VQATLALRRKILRKFLTSAEVEFLRVVFSDIDMRIFIQRESEAGNAMIGRYRAHTEAFLCEKRT